MGIACLFDFLDGFLARLLNSHSPIGKQLDSLADMVTFGVVPGVVMFKLLKITISTFPLLNHAAMELFFYLPYFAFLIPLFSALRLAKFNIDNRQTDSFIGLPTPANSIFICSLPLIFINRFNYFSSHLEIFPPGNHALHDDVFLEFILNPWLLICVTLIMSILLIAEIPLFALKFKSFGWKGNEIRYVFLALCVVLLATLQFVGIPLTIVLYVLMSVINNLARKKSGTNY